MTERRSYQDPCSRQRRSRSRSPLARGSRQESPLRSPRGPAAAIASSSSSNNEVKRLTNEITVPSRRVTADKFFVLHDRLDALVSPPSASETETKGPIAGSWNEFAHNALAFQKILKDSAAIGSSRSIGQETRAKMINATERIFRRFNADSHEADGSLILATKRSGFIQIPILNYVATWYDRQNAWTRHYEIERLSSPSFKKLLGTTAQEFLAIFDSYIIDPEALRSVTEFRAVHGVDPFPFSSEDLTLLRLENINNVLGALRKIVT